MEKVQKNKRGKLKWIIIIVIVVALIGAAAGNSEDDTPKKVENTESNEKNDNTKNATTESEPDKVTEFKVGDTAEQKDIQITFVSTIESSGSEFIKPSTGKAAHIKSSLYFPTILHYSQTSNLSTVFHVLGNTLHYLLLFPSFVLFIIVIDTGNVFP